MAIPRAGRRGPGVECASSRSAAPGPFVLCPSQRPKPLASTRRMASFHRQPAADGDSGQYGDGQPQQEVEGRGPPVEGSAIGAVATTRRARLRRAPRHRTRTRTPPHRPAPGRPGARPRPSSKRSWLRVRRRLATPGASGRGWAVLGWKIVPRVARPTSVGICSSLVESARLTSELGGPPRTRRRWRPPKHRRGCGSDTSWPMRSSARIDYAAGDATLHDQVAVGQLGRGRRFRLGDGNLIDVHGDLPADVWAMVKLLLATAPAVRSLTERLSTAEVEPLDPLSWHCTQELS